MVERHQDGMDRGELAASFHHLSQAMAAAEVPILRSHGVTMWEYIILRALEKGPASNQSELAIRAGRDRTRLIHNLDALESAGLLRRVRDPADRRNSSVELTNAGYSILKRCRGAIRQMEDQRLSSLTETEKRVFLTSLKKLGTDS